MTPMYCCKKIQQGIDTENYQLIVRNILNLEYLRETDPQFPRQSQLPSQFTEDKIITLLNSIPVPSWDRYMFNNLMFLIGSSPDFSREVKEILLMLNRGEVADIELAKFILQQDLDSKSEYTHMAITLANLYLLYMEEKHASNS